MLIKNINNKKIALFIPSLRGGGAEKMMINLANSFIEKNIKVDFILAQKEGPYLENISKNINIVNLNSRRILFSLFPLIKYLKKEKPDFLISTLTHSNIITLLAKISSFSKTKIIIRSASTFSLSLKKLSIHKRFIHKYGAMILYRLAYKIIANSKKSANDLSKILRISEEKIKVIYNPTVTPDIFIKAKEKGEHPWINNKKSPIILGVGRLNKAKNFPVLIKAIKIIKKRIDLKLIILGEGPERKNLEILIKKLNLQDFIDLAGFKNNPYAFMSEADVYTLSSDWEGLPNVLIEAMACGVPVVSTNCPSGPSEILENGKYGKLVPVNNPEALAKTIEETLNNPIDSSKLQERANFFSVDKAVNKYLEIMKYEKN